MLKCITGSVDSRVVLTTIMGASLRLNITVRCTFDTGVFVFYRDFGAPHLCCVRSLICYGVTNLC